MADVESPVASSAAPSLARSPRFDAGWRAFLADDALPPERVSAQDALKASWRADVPAALVVMLVALPLCLGIALASGAPLGSGLVAGIVGGLVVGAISGSQLMVSGPAAGLSAIVLAGIASAGSFQLFLVAVILGGALQVGLSIARAGIIGYYFPSSVIKGMLAAIGVILILKQLPHAVGYDADYEGDESFAQTNAENSFSALGSMFDQLQLGAVLIAVAALTVLILWERPAFRAVRKIPAAMVVVLLAVGLNALFAASIPSLAIPASHLVNLPVGPESGGFMAFFQLPDVAGFTSPTVWRLGVTIAIVASLETLLSLEATDKLDPYRRESDTNRELLAQGVGNMISGAIGGLPITGVIVRSAANINAGAQTRWSAILHGVFLLLAVLLIPAILNLIPLSALAAILLFTGFKLAAPRLIRAMWGLGPKQFIPFATTIVAIVLTDLLIGIGIGLTVGLFFILGEQLRQPALRRVSHDGAVLTKFALPEHASFLNKANIERTLDALPVGARVEIDGRQTQRFDHDVLEQLHEFTHTARLRNIDYRLVGVPDKPTAAAGGH